MTESKRTKCTLTKDNLNPCWIMDARLEPEANYGIGLQLIVTGSIYHEKRIVEGVAHAITKAKASLTKLPPRMMLNYCPWCGARLLRKEEKK